MSSANSSVGLVSGLPIGDLVERSLTSQRNSISLIDTRVKNISALRTALLDLSARILSLKGKSAIFKTASFFGATKATPSNADALRATVTGTAAAGDYRVLVRQLASTHQLFGNGYASSDASFLSAGTLTIESAAGRVDNTLPLNVLRGGQGVRGGVVRITDKAGATTDIDLTLARNVEDVLAAVNNQTTVGVRARISGDRIVFEDTTHATGGSLTIADVGNGHAAADLGVAGTSTGGTLTSGDLVSLSRDLRLGSLNDGNGVRRNAGGADLRIGTRSGANIDVDLSGTLTATAELSQLNNGTGIAAGSIRVTNKAGASATVDLSGAHTVGDVLAAINASGLNITASISGSSLLLSDGSTGTNATKVEESGGGTTARDLGLLVSPTNGTLKGSSIYRIETLGDVITAINNAAGNGGKVTAAISTDGESLTLTDNTAGAGELHVEAQNGSKAALDLGLLDRDGSSGTLSSSRLLGGLDTVLLRSIRGGNGVRLGVVSITDRSGATAEVDLRGAQTLSEAIDRINSSGTGVQARVSDTGLGLILSDSTGGSGPLRIVDVVGESARDLGISTENGGATFRGANLQRQYISENSRLDQLDGGRGVPRGKFRITNAAGTSAVVDLTQGNENTLRDVIDEINSRGIGVTARINDNGDGLLLEDTSTGAGTLTVTEEGGTTARALRILGTARNGSRKIEGSGETRIEVSGNDTLASLVTKINAAGGAANAAIINDGSAAGGFHLTLTSARSGVSGRLAFDTDTTGLSFSTLVRGRDAAVQIGGEDGNPGVVLTSSTNSIEGAVGGVRLDLLAAGTSPVTISVASDTKAITDKLDEFVQSFNAILSRIDDLSKFNSTTGDRGVFLGDRSADEVRRRLESLLTTRVPGVSSQYARLSAVGLTFANGRISFDSDKFNTAYAADPDSVTKLFSQEKTGIVAKLETEVSNLTESGKGTLVRRSDSLSDTTTSLTKRKEQLTSLMEARRSRLLAQYQATEAAIAKLQSQGSALGSLTNLASSFGSSSSGLGLGG